MLLNLTDISNESLHLQISRQIRAQILAGHLAPGDNLPSIRALARENRVSVITVQTAYDALEREGLLIVRRGKGFFVADITRKSHKATAIQRFESSLQTLVKSAFAEGLNTNDLRQIVEKTLTGRNVDDTESQTTYSGHSK